MNLRSFEQDFTKDLESFVKHPVGWEPITPLKVWSAKKTAAPERHKILGVEAGLPPQTQIYLLDKENSSFQVIESMLRMYLSPIEYSTYDSFTQIDTEAEQVWLFAMRWLESYYECLMEPMAIKTEFYKHHNGRFLELMRKMLVFNPKNRISFGDALKFWYPGSGVFLEHSLNEEDSSSMKDPYPLGDLRSQTEEDKMEESSNECHNPPLAEQEDKKEESSNECHNPPPSSSVSHQSYCTTQEPVQNADLPSSPSSVPNVVTTARSRLVLKRWGGHEEHNKTRRSPSNSGRSPAIGNRGTRVRG